ncbi:MAG: tRNA pseudouridine(38-40) synthase TruA [Chloroflexota bacterium]|nr:tRNA pseudouridine(38-40) synthase TruA [Chloroflexota bacterium]
MIVAPAEQLNVLGQLALTISYDGREFHGSQVQATGRSVQGELERALGSLGRGPQRVVFAGRTDSGVHAVGQVASCADHWPDLGPDELVRAINANLEPDAAVLRIERRLPGFQARFDARWREYRYRVWSGPAQPLAREWVWRRTGPFDLGAMVDAAQLLQGEHDFAAFAGGGQGVPSSPRRRQRRGTIRRVRLCSCRALNPWWGPAIGQLCEVRVVADGFLPRMVRSIVAALVEVGRGKRPVDSIPLLLASRDRRQGCGTAPAHGLILWRVGYGEDEPEPERCPT